MAEKIFENYYRTVDSLRKKNAELRDIEARYSVTRQRMKGSVDSSTVEEHAKVKKQFDTLNEEIEGLEHDKEILTEQILSVFEEHPELTEVVIDPNNIGVLSAFKQQSRTRSALMAITADLKNRTVDMISKL